MRDLKCCKFDLHKTTMGYAKMPQAESLKVHLIRDIIGDEYIVHLSNDEKEEILHFACTS